MTNAEQDAYTDFLNDIEKVAEKHGWNIGIAPIIRVRIVISQE